MSNLKDYIDEYIKEGYTRNYAISKVCQDIIINRIYNSKYSDKITIKGGVVMFHLTKNIRRATIDLDMDLINLSIATENIVEIFLELSKLDNMDGFKLKIDKNKIEELSHQDYHGKRLTAIISDKNKKSYSIKLDIGVHKCAEIYQETLLLDTNILDCTITFLANPKEQIFIEKLIPMLKFGPLSTRYRDIFDIYWLIMNGKLNKDKIIEYMKILVFESDIKISSFADVAERIKLVLDENRFANNLSNNYNWTEDSISNIIEIINQYMEGLEEIKV